MSLAINQRKASSAKEGGQNQILQPPDIINWEERLVRRIVRPTALHLCPAGMQDRGGGNHCHSPTDTLHNVVTILYNIVLASNLYQDQDDFQLMLPPLPMDGVAKCQKVCRVRILSTNILWEKVSLRELLQKQKRYRFSDSI